MNWSEDQKIDGEDIIRIGQAQFYSPPVLPGERVQHEWTFLTPWADFTTQSGVDSVLLPEDFGGLTSDITFISENSGPCPIKIVSDDKIRRMKQGVTTINGYPDCCCIIPVQSDGSTSQRWQAVFFPTPDGNYPLKMRYRSNPSAINDSQPYPLGGQPAADALLASVLAAGESRLSDTQGVRYMEFIQKLQAAVAYDRSRNVRSLGYCGDPSIHESPSDQSPYQQVTRLYLNGVEL